MCCCRCRMTPIYVDGGNIISTKAGIYRLRMPMNDLDGNDRRRQERSRAHHHSVHQASHGAACSTFTHLPTHSTLILIMMQQMAFLNPTTPRYTLILIPPPPNMKKLRHFSVNPQHHQFHPPPHQ